VRAGASYTLRLTTLLKVYLSVGKVSSTVIAS